MDMISKKQRLNRKILVFRCIFHIQLRYGNNAIIHTNNKLPIFIIFTKLVPLSCKVLIFLIF